GFRLAHRYIYYVNDPSYIHHILQDNHRNYKKSLAYKKLSLMLGNGLFTSDGDFWLRQRRLAQPAFHKERIEGYFEIIKRHVSEFIVTSRCATDSLALGSEMTKLTLKIIAEALLGLNLHNRYQVVEEKLPWLMRFMIRRITSGLNTPLWLPTSSNKNFRFFTNEIRDMIQEMIREKRKDPAGNHDLLTDLIKAVDEETGEGMSNEQLTDEVLTFFLAGHETTAVAAFWTMYLLEINPRARKCLLQELEVIQFDQLKLDDLQALSYLDAVIKESMRLYSPVWVLGREALGDDQLGPYDVKKGDSIIFSPYLIHRHTAFWQKPDEFEPARFLNGTQIVKNTYIPFGNGPRLCIGKSFSLLELKVMLIAMVKELDLRFEDRSFPGFDCSLTLRPAHERYVKPGGRP
ncbi:MAG: cytochrome P450, partial [Bacteroidota bacterium]